MLTLSLLAARAHRDDLAQQARRACLKTAESPVTRVTLRYAAAADAPRLRDLAELDSASPPDGPVLVAEVDGRLRAALPVDGGAPISDPFHRGRELLELLRLRAEQLRMGAAGA
jgi:hypothetical protein